MTKSELKPGYVVKYRNGSLRMVMPLDNENSLIEMCPDAPAWCSLRDFNEDLTCKFTNMRDIDIMEVYGCSRYNNSVWKFDARDRKLLWKRQEKKKYTYAQLREILGEEFEVVG